MYPQIWVIIALGCMTSMIAVRKGYSFIFWLVSPLFLGLLVLVALPFANRPDMPAEQQKALRTRGNLIGAILSWLAVAGLLYLSYIARHPK